MGISLGQFNFKLQYSYGRTQYNLVIMYTVVYTAVQLISRRDVYNAAYFYCVVLLGINVLENVRRIEGKPKEGITASRPVRQNWLHNQHGIVGKVYNTTTVLLHTRGYVGIRT